MKQHIGMAMRIWKIVKGMSTSELRLQMENPVTLSVVGTAANVDTISRRLATERASGIPTPHEAADDLAHIDRTGVGPLAMTINADEVLASEGHLAARFDEIVAANHNNRVSLALNYPALRPAVVQSFAHDMALTNAKLAGLSALPGILPAGDFLLPFTAAGDMIALTRNQMELFLQVAASYGVPPDLEARVREFAIVVGGAFLWRAAARQLLGAVPAGIGVAVKAGVAYGGTYAVGRAAAAYYFNGGHRVGAADLRRFARESFRRRSIE